MSRNSVSPQPKTSEADAVGYLAKVLTDWESSLDPLSVQKALDLLAARVPGGAVTSIFGRTGAVVAVEGDYDVDKLDDADTTTAVPVLNDVLKWNGSDWVPGTAGDTTEFTFSIDSFNDGISNADDTQLIGAGTWKAVGAVSFTATYSNPPGGMTATVEMSGSDVNWAGDLSMTGTPPEGATTNTELVKYPTSQGGTITFTLSQSADASEDTETVDFNNTMRYGTNAQTQGNQTDGGVEALTEVGTATSPNESLTQTISNIPADAGKLLTFAFATRLATLQQIRRDSGSGFVTAAFAASATTVLPLAQTTNLTAIANSATYSEAFEAVTSLNTDMTNGTNDFQLLTNSTAQNYIYWGELNKASSYTEADVENNNATQPGKVASNTMSSRSMTVNATGSEYTYIAYPARMGALTSIVIGGFESINDFNVDTTTLAVTNDAGFQENYRVYVSKNPGFTDPTTMTVTI